MGCERNETPPATCDPRPRAIFGHSARDVETSLPAGQSMQRPSSSMCHHSCTSQATKCCACCASACGNSSKYGLLVFAVTPRGRWGLITTREDASLCRTQLRERKRCGANRAPSHTGGVDKNKPEHDQHTCMTCKKLDASPAHAALAGALAEDALLTDSTSKITPVGLLCML